MEEILVQTGELKNEVNRLNEVKRNLQQKISEIKSKYQNALSELEKKETFLNNEIATI